MLKEQLKRRRYITGTEKIHTSIYLLPRHREFIKFIMKTTGTSMTDVICNLIDKAIKEYTKRVPG